MAERPQATTNPNSAVEMREGKGTDLTFAKALTASGAPSILDPHFAAYLDKTQPATTRHHFSIPARKTVGAVDVDQGVSLNQSYAL